MSKEKQAAIVMIFMVFVMFASLILGAALFERPAEKPYRKFIKDCMEDGKKEYECIAMWRR